MQEPTSRTLLLQLAQGSDSAWKRFFDTYKVLVYMRGHAWHLNNSDVEDLLITVMQKFFDKSKDYQYDRSKGRFRDYFARMIRNAAVDMFRSRGRNAEVTLGEKSAEIFDSIPADASADMESVRRDFQARIAAKAIQQVKSRVSVKAFQCWSMYYQDGLRPKEIAAFLGLDEKTVYYHKNVVAKELAALSAQLQENEDSEALLQ